MDIVDFYPATFHEIPKQDNPAFGTEECLMIVREDGTRSGHAVVLQVAPDPIETVTPVAKFWSHEKALEYCELISPDLPKVQKDPDIQAERKLFEDAHHHLFDFSTYPTQSGKRYVEEDANGYFKTWLASAKIQRNGAL